MLTQLNFKAPSVKLSKLSSLWLQLTGVTCNLKCKHCYLSCIPNDKVKNFLSFDKIKLAIEESKKFMPEEIYLHGGEPLLHPDINNIIRLCLKHANVTILTNCTLINDKKARFLRQIEQDHDNELIFRVSLDHYLEEKNDDLRGRGSYKKIINGIENLIRYGFNPIISVVNFGDNDLDEFKKGFLELFEKLNLELDESNLKFIPTIKLGDYAKNFGGYDENEFVTQKDVENSLSNRFDCARSRVITDNGVFVCPVLINDPRGKVGNSLSDMTDRFFLEPSACYTCVKHNTGIFNNNW